MKRELVLATANKDKAIEIYEILASLPLEIITIEAYPGLILPEEDQATFRGNAILKAEAVSAYSGKMAVADDSGLVVDALDGRPGVYSARYAGPDGDYEANNRLLLEELKEVPYENRSARFICAIALCIPGKRTYVVKGSCPGRITMALSGSKGFGYDPLFYYEPAGKTFAEMSRGEKNTVSHRGRALRNLRGLLKQLLTI